VPACPAFSRNRRERPTEIVIQDPRPSTEPPLAPGERVLGRLDTDFDPAGRFVQGELLLTDRRLLARDGEAGGAWEAIDLAPQLRLRLSDHGGVGTLELHGVDARIGRWRYLMRRQDQAAEFVERARQRLSGVEREAEPGPHCAACGAALGHADAPCPACDAAEPAQDTAP